MKNTLIFKRIIAYIIDIFIVSLISTALVELHFINPKYEEYNKVQNEYNNILENYYKENIDIKELSSSINKLNYSLNKYGYVYIIGEIVITFLYFGVFNYITKGQTLGKKLLKIQIVSKDNSELKIYNYFIRTFILNDVISKCITLVALLFKEHTFNKINNIGSSLTMLLTIGIFVTILVMKDNRGLHDLASNTLVIDLKNNKALDAEEEKES